MIFLFWIVLVFLILVSIIDWKFKAVPSVLLTSVIFLLIILNSQNLLYGISAFILAYMLIEFSYFDGVADLKVMVIIGLMISSLQNFLIFSGLTVFYGIVYKSIYKIRNPKAKDTPFIPVFIFVYLTLYLVGGINWNEKI